MEIPRHWRLKAQRYRMQGSLCPGCHRFIFPPRRICPHCSAALQKEIPVHILLPQPFGSREQSEARVFEADFHQSERA